MPCAAAATKARPWVQGWPCRVQLLHMARPTLAGRSAGDRLLHRVGLAVCSRQGRSACPGWLAVCSSLQGQPAYTGLALPCAHGRPTLVQAGSAGDRLPVTGLALPCAAVGHRPTACTWLALPCAAVGHLTDCLHRVGLAVCSRQATGLSGWPCRVQQSAKANLPVTGLALPCAAVCQANLPVHRVGLAVCSSGQADPCYRVGLAVCSRRWPTACTWLALPCAAGRPPADCLHRARPTLCSRQPGGDRLLSQGKALPCAAVCGTVPICLSHGWPCRVQQSATGRLLHRVGLAVYSSLPPADCLHRVGLAVCSRLVTGRLPAQGWPCRV